MTLLGRREIIAYTFTFTMAFITIFCVMTGQYVEAVVTGFVGMANMVVGYYFGKRNAEEETATKPGG
jgi:hypothetical protein